MGANELEFCWKWRICKERWRNKQKYTFWETISPNVSWKRLCI